MNGRFETVCPRFKEFFFIILIMFKASSLNSVREDIFTKIRTYFTKIKTKFTKIRTKFTKIEQNSQK